MQGDGSRSQERLDRLGSNLVYGEGSVSIGCRAQVIGGTPAQFRTCKAHYLARSFVAHKRRYTGEYNTKKIDESLTSPRHLNEIIIAKIYVLIFRPTGLLRMNNTHKCKRIQEYNQIDCTQVYENTRIQSNLLHSCIRVHLCALFILRTACWLKHQYLHIFWL